MRARIAVFGVVVALVGLIGGILTIDAATASPSGSRHRHVVVIPATDKFTPYHITVHVGDTVMWVNNDTDDHTVVSDDAFNTEGHQGLNHLIPGTDNNGGKPGVFRLRMDHPGTFVYYCRFHAHLDEDAQPVAPGPEGGIQDANGNFGTPMNGIVSVVDGGHFGHR